VQLGCTLCFKFISSFGIGAGIGDINNKNTAECFENLKKIYRPDNIINGYNRPYLLPNLWISDKITSNTSQYIDLLFDDRKEINEIIIFFNSNLNIERNNLRPGLWRKSDCEMPRELVKEYKIFTLNDDAQPSQLLIHEKNNKGRYVKHKIEYCNNSGLNCTVKANGIRIEVIDTWGNPYAEIFEVRIY